MMLAPASTSNENAMALFTLPIDAIFDNSVRWRHFRAANSRQPVNGHR
jgi:hypothetical protein